MINGVKDSTHSQNNFEKYERNAFPQVSTNNPNKVIELIPQIETPKNEGNTSQYLECVENKEVGYSYSSRARTKKDFQRHSISGKLNHYYRTEVMKDHERPYQSFEGENNLGQHNLENYRQNGIETTKSNKEAFQEYMKSAEDGNSVEQFNLGNCYQNGIGNDEEAFRWYIKSAEGGNSVGKYNLGFCYRNGIGVTKDDEKAFQWYLKSAEGGNSAGQFNVGYHYMYGIGTTKDEKVAFTWYLKSAEGGDISGQNSLGNCYRNGVGITKSDERAFHWYMKSAESGNNAGQCNLGYCFLNGIGTEKDDVKAFRWYSKSAEGGSSAGKNNLGDCYRNGIGTGKDYKKAFQWYSKSASDGNSVGQFNLGICYQNAIGTAKNDEQAFNWYLKSAEGGNGAGKNNLGYCYQYGIGTKVDKEKAFKWYSNSAEGGDTNGQYNLGVCYNNGIGTTRDEEKAFQWYLKSAESGNKWIPYSQFQDIRYLGQGGYGIIFKATWVQEPRKSIKVALKSLRNSGNITADFLREVIFNRDVKTEKFIIQCFGITRNDETNTYMMVMEYAEEGSLYQYLLNNFEKITWIEKLEKLHYIAEGFEQIHNRVIHCDIHSGNILLGVVNGRESIRIADLGLCKQIRSSFKPKNVHGVIPYIAPEVFMEHSFTQASDVYSFGILMWEFTSGYRPFKNRKHDHFLILDIINGLRPEITEDTPSAFANLMKKCWSHGQFDRPSMHEIKQQFGKWLSKDKEEFIFAEEIRKGLIEKGRLKPEENNFMHSKAYYTSRLLDTVIQKSSEVIKYTSVQEDLVL